MGGSKSHKQKKCMGLFNMLKTKRWAHIADQEDASDDYCKAYKVYPSDQDRGPWVAEPGIDSKASAYISTKHHHFCTFQPD